jgi:hypothetical protein
MFSCGPLLTRVDTVEAPDETLHAAEIKAVMYAGAIIGGTDHFQIQMRAHNRPLDIATRMPTPLPRSGDHPIDGSVPGGKLYRSISINGLHLLNQAKTGG